MKTFDTLIIGGGIGGLTAAIALRQRGIDAAVFEGAPELQVVGAGIAVPTNAMQVLDRLGLAEAVQEQGQPIVRAEMRDSSGELLQNMDLREVRERFGFSTVAIHRARLQQVLAQQIPAASLHLGKQLEKLTLLADHVRLEFADGSTAAAAVVIGADGLRSAVRSQIFPEVQLRYSGQSSYRGVACHRIAAELQGLVREVWGPGCRFGFCPIAENQVYWFATIDAPAGETDGPGEAKPRLEVLFESFTRPAPQLIAATPASAITRTDMYDFSPIESWHRGRVVLLGDAAHATTPNLGQGGAQAIEDAYVLATELAGNPDPEDAFLAYEKVRMAKAKWVVTRSWQFGKLVHLTNPTARTLRNLVLRNTPESVTRAQMDSLFALNY